MPDGWGEVSYWPSERIEKGDWTAAVWRSPILAHSAYRFANHPDLKAIAKIRRCTVRDARRRLYENFKRSTIDHPESIPVLDSKGAEAQGTIEGTPDSYWIPQSGRERQAAHYVKWASQLLVTGGQDTSTARLTATASSRRHLGVGWSPVTGPSDDEAKSLSVFINSTVGRLQLLRNPSQKTNVPYLHAKDNSISKGSRHRRRAHTWHSHGLLGANEGYGRTSIPRRRVRGTPPVG